MACLKDSSEIESSNITIDRWHVASAHVIEKETSNVDRVVGRGSWVLNKRPRLLIETLEEFGSRERGHGREARLIFS